jgi:hypothetical protein
METQEILKRIIAEYERAEIKHPDWPVDIVHQTSIISEECGELVREGNLIREGEGNIENLIEECIQTAAMCFRLLKNLPE